MAKSPKRKSRGRLNQKTMNMRLRSAKVSDATPPSSPSSPLDELDDPGVTSSKSLMRTWLIHKAEFATYKGLKWLDENKTMMRIPWQHGSSQVWVPEDTALYKDWAKHSGRSVHMNSEPKDSKRWKANFRCAINSLPDVKEVKTQSKPRGPDAFRVYEFKPKQVRRSEVRRSLKAKTSRISRAADQPFAEVDHVESPPTPPVQLQLPPVTSLIMHANETSPLAGSHDHCYAQAPRITSSNGSPLPTVVETINSMAPMSAFMQHLTQSEHTEDYTLDGNSSGDDSAFSEAASEDLLEDNVHVFLQREMQSDQVLSDMVDKSSDCIFDYLRVADFDPSEAGTSCTLMELSALKV